MADTPHLLWFEDIDKDDGALVGGKGANLGEMVKAGFPVPDGFVVTAPAYFYVLDHNYLRDKIKHQLDNVDLHDPHELTTAAASIKRLINRANIPKDLAKEILLAYHKLGSDSLVAVRSSATAEDLPGASFAGQQETFLNVKGDANVVNTVRSAWASLFEPRAIFYRAEKGFDHFKVGIAVPVQLMVQSEISGIMFTVNPTTNDKEIIVIEAIWGLGEKIVQGAITPDHYQVSKKTWTIHHKELIEQHTQLVKRYEANKEIAVPKNKQQAQKLSDDQIIKLAKLGQQIHQHYFFPQDIEWAYIKGKFFIVQTRPITTLGTVKSDANTKQQLYDATKNLKHLVSGDSASPGIVSGPVRIVPSAKNIDKVKQGDILVTEMTTPDFVPVMKKAAALVTDKGGQTSHAAIVSRELGLPCIVGTENATRLLKTGQIVTVNAKTGDVFAGSIPAKRITSIKNQVVKASPRITTRNTATKVYVNLAEPELASEMGKRNVDGIGLLRAEFMMAQIGIHPKKILEDKKSKDYIDTLADNLSQFCVSFGDRPVIYRTSDFKTNEYRHLTGGKYFEPEEENPMLGYRGAFRYTADPATFALELAAVKKVRNDYGYKNLHLMLPFVRTAGELASVKRQIAGSGLIRSPSFKLILMVEIPANVVILEDFASIGIDGISIGSNDLTMLVLGADRDNAEIASVYDEQNPAVLWFLEQAIKKAKKLGLTSSICGQAPSLYPDLTQKLVDWGITSISVSPDMIDQTREIIYEAEKRKINRS